MECRLSSSDKEWTCKVSIRWEYDSDGTKNLEILEIPFGEPIRDKNEVEIRLRQAQLAILHPAVKSPLHFLGSDVNQLKEELKGSPSLLFSRNVVCVDLQGPALPNLSFIDLPGTLSL
jgi:hypothetical protein